jgi:hypothetical protein
LVPIMVLSFPAWIGCITRKFPDGHRYVTIPGSALLFPGLCAPTGALPTPEPARADRCGDKTAMVPLRTTIRVHNHAHRIAAERQHNRMARTTREKCCERGFSALPNASADEEPPPF